ncbi:hypothetical protein [Microcoleus sp. AT9b-C3]|uniref:hypothetical protein n=1 Tax=Microcoleus sp. AT9b-C3 TaxID=2818629 RepID=UPI002FD49A9E
MTEYRLTPAKYRQVQVVVCLNRVRLDGYANSDEALAKLSELGYSPQLRYQWNPERDEFDLYALIHDLPLDESLMTEEKCQEFFKHFRHSQIYSIGCGHADPDWLFAWGFNDPRRHATPEEIEPLEANATATV